MERIFVNYRRGDSPGHAGRLYDHLVSHFGETMVFRDIEAIQLGADFVVSIEQAIGRCSVLLVVIGPQWLDSRDKRGQRRLDDPKDFVRLEIVSALKRGIRTIPVLVGDALMPSEEELPPDLAPLARRRAMELSDLRFPSDVDQLIHFLESTAGIRPPSSELALPPHTERSAEPPEDVPAPALPAQEGPRPPFQDPGVQSAHSAPRRARVVLSALLVVAVALVALVFLNDRGKTPVGRLDPSFQVAMPGNPVRKDALHWQSDAGGVIYVIILEEKLDAAPPATQIEETVRGLTRFYKGTLESAKDITLQGHPGKAYTISVHDENHSTVKGRTFLVGRRLYTLYGISNPTSVGAREVDGFLTSFELIDPPPPLKPGS